MAPILRSPRRPSLTACSPSLASPRAPAQPSPRAFKHHVASAYGPEVANIHEPWEVYVADLDLTRGDFEDPATPTRFAPPMSTVQCAAAVRRDEEVRRLKEDNKALHLELATARDELNKSRNEAQQLQMQLAKKKRTVQAYKAEQILSHRELQRARERAALVDDAVDSEYRRYVLDAQQELQTVRARFVEWPDDGKSREEARNRSLSKRGKSSHPRPLEQDAAKGEVLPVTAAAESAPEAFQAALQALTDLSQDLFLQTEQDGKLLQGS